MTPLRLATRRSALALAQSRWLAARLSHANPGLDVRLVEIVTSGDRDRTTPIAQLTEVGAFVKALQEAVLDGRADAAVHSLKDLPTAPAGGLTIVGIPAREDPRDVLVSDGVPLAELPARARVGTSSPRRVAQVRLARPDVEVVALRGNVDTRLRRVRDHDLDAVVLAGAGLRRLGREDEVVEWLDPEVHVPCPGQGALALEARAGDERLATLGARVHDADTAATVLAERGWLHAIGAGCRSAAGAFARSASDGRLMMTCFLADARGTRHLHVAGAPGEIVGLAVSADR